MGFWVYVLHTESLLVGFMNNYSMALDSLAHPCRATGTMQLKT